MTERIVWRPSSSHQRARWHGLCRISGSRAALSLCGQVYRTRWRRGEPMPPTDARCCKPCMAAWEQRVERAS